MSDILVSPSILSADFSKLEEEIKSVERAGADFLHLDIMDGVFVPNLTFGPVVVEGIRKLTSLPMDAHLMIVDPLKYAEQFARAGADYIIFHVESKSSIPRTINVIKSLGKKVGLSVRPKTTLGTVFPYLEVVDYILIMSVEPGFAGQQFMKSVLPKIEKLRKLKDEGGFKYIIAVDGGINEETAKLAVKAGAELLVSATYIFGASDRKRAIEHLKNSGL